MHRAKREASPPYGIRALVAIIVQKKGEAKALMKNFLGGNFRFNIGRKSRFLAKNGGF
jgi:hypothetical protein